MSAKKPNILVCPLDWGIGHATRCIPLINHLKDREVNVIIGADNRPLMLLRQEFPDMPFIRFPGYRFTYPQSSGMALKMFFQAPGILKGIRQENHRLDQIIRQYAIDAVISDNRYGLHSDRVPSIFMTHQVFIQTPPTLRFLKPLLYRLNQHYISKFKECWIPDFPGDVNLSGALSHKRPLPDNYQFIGPQTRFKTAKNVETKKSQFEILGLVSGPEPQRTILEKKLLAILRKSDKSAAVLLGKPEVHNGQTQLDNLTVFHHLDAHSLEKLIHSSDIIISRPGYSTLMDLSALQKKAVFIPTPGQTEQEYLAHHCEKQKLCYWMSQDQFDLEKALALSGNYTGLNLRPDPALISERIDALIEQIKRN